MSHACHRLWKCDRTLTFCSLLTRCTIPCACHAKRALNVKSGPNLVCFVHFGLEMCFAPQRRALFRHRNFQKCIFSTSQLPKVVRQWCVLYILTSKCASRHNGVHFFDISPSKSGPTTEGCAFLENRIRYVYNFTIDAVGTPGLSSCLGTVPESPISLILTLWHKQ